MCMPQAKRLCTVAVTGDQQDERRVTWQGKGSSNVLLQGPFADAMGVQGRCDSCSVQLLVPMFFLTIGTKSLSDRLYQQAT